MKLTGLLDYGNIRSAAKGASELKGCLNLPSDVVCEVPNVTGEEIAAAAERSVLSLSNTIQDS